MSFYMNSDRGNVRKSNEDSFLFDTFDELNIMILADGMGGHSSGELASRLAVNTVMEYIKTNVKLYDNYSVLLVDAFCKANEYIYNYNIENVSDFEEKINYMGTTLEAIIIKDNEMFFAHVGDSRIYKKDFFGLKRLTIDHSLVEYLYSKGALTFDEAKNFKNKNSILRAIGTEKYIEVDTGFEYLKNDIILVCSDGLTNEMCDKDLDEFLVFSKDAKSMVNDIIENVKSGNCKDNITVGIYINEVE